MKQVVQTKFYHFRQNNSGGSFDFDESEGLTLHVIIEGLDLDHITSRAESILTSSGDCSCCGSRWCMPWSGESTDDVPSVYGEPVETFKDESSRWCRDEIPADKEICVHYIDGRKEWF